MNIEELKAIMELARAMGVQELHYEGLRLVFGPPAPPALLQTSGPRPPGEDELLFYSTETFDALKLDRGGDE